MVGAGTAATGAAGGPGSIAALLMGLLVLLASGDGLLRLLGRAGLVRAAGAAEGLGLRILLALASVPWWCLILDLATVPITRVTFGLLALALAVAGGWVDRSGWIGLLPRAAGGAGRRPDEGARAGGRARSNERPRSDGAPSPARLRATIARAPAAAVLALAVAGIVLFSLTQVGLSAPRAYDALVGFDAVGKLMAYEGRLRSTLFTHITYDPQCVYPPFTSCNQGFWYLFFPPIQRLWVPLLAAGFLLAFWGWIRRWTASATAAAVAAFLVLLPPELAFHVTEGQTDLPSMIYTTMAMLSAVAWLRGRGGAGPVALYMLCATTARSENVLFAAALALAGAIGARTRRWTALWVAAAPAAFFVFWNLIFVRGLLGYDPAAHFRHDVTFDLARLAEVLDLAVTILWSHGAFGEFAWAIPLASGLWLLGWWARRTGRLAAAQDPGVTGPLLLLVGLGFVFYMPFFYMWDDVLNPLWTMAHTYKRGVFRFIPPVTAALVAAPPLLALLRRCERPAAEPAPGRGAAEPGKEGPAPIGAQ